MSDARLVTPAEACELVVDVLRRRHSEHLAAAERRRGVAPQTYERLRTVAHRHDPRNRYSADTCPAVLVGCSGSLEEPTRNESDALDLVLALDVEVAVIGQPADLLLRRDVTAWSVAECLLQRVPRSGIVTGLRLRDVENVEFGESSPLLATVRFIFAADVPDALSLVGLPAEDEGWPPGGPGGAPEDPYDVPIDLGQVTEIETEIVREPITTP